ncbi:hypothetical protein GF362_07205 [Candidatus Dojkabacteria bacterium]|nr:hypothetical protein [Candidatus Dojkabacteria bacterium]
MKENNKSLFYAFAAFIVSTVILILVIIIKGGKVNADNIIVTNLKDTSATVFYTTDKPTIGKVTVNNTVYYDDRDIQEKDVGIYEYNSEKAQKRFTHHVTIRDLSPETTYTYEIQDAKYKEGENNNFTTNPILKDINSPDPVYGRVFDANKKAVSDGTVLFKRETEDGTKSQFISSVIANGSYSFDVQHLYINDYSGLFQGTDSDDETIGFFADTGKSVNEAKLIFKASEDQPVDDAYIGDNVEAFDPNNQKLLDKVYARMECPEGWRPVGNNCIEDTVPTPEETEEPTPESTPEETQPQSTGGSSGGNTSCFLKGTKISLSNGKTKNIEDIQIGESIMSFDITNKVMGVSFVRKIEKPIRENYYIINKKLKLTSEHPVYIKKQNGYVGWGAISPQDAQNDHHIAGMNFEIQKIEEEDMIYDINGKWMKIESIIYREEKVQTFNLVGLTPYNTYFAEDILVHNKIIEGGDTDTPTPEESTPPEQIRGCTDELALNYNPEAEVDDGSCRYSNDPDPTDGQPPAGAGDPPVGQEEDDGQDPCGDYKHGDRMCNKYGPPGELYICENGSRIKLKDCGANEICSGVSCQPLTTTDDDGGSGTDGDGNGNETLSCNCLVGEDCVNKDFYALDYNSCTEACRDMNSETCSRDPDSEPPEGDTGNRACNNGDVPHGGKACLSNTVLGECRDMSYPQELREDCTATHGSNYHCRGSECVLRPGADVAVEPDGTGQTGGNHQLCLSEGAVGSDEYNSCMGIETEVNCVDVCETSLDTATGCGAGGRCANNSVQKIYSNCGEHTDCEGGYADCVVHPDCNNGGEMMELNFKNIFISKVQAQETETSESVEPGVYLVQGNNIRTKSIEVMEEGPIQFYWDTNGNGMKDEDEEYLTDEESQGIQININKVAENQVYDLKLGWNLISIPMVMEGENTSNIRMASELLKNINDQGAEATHLATYRSGQFLIYSNREEDSGVDHEFGDDYAILPGEGYFVKNYSSAEIFLKGKKVEGSLPVQINSGWNLISIYNQNKPSYQGFDVLRMMNSQMINADTLSKWEGGMYYNVILKDGVEYGNDFKVYPVVGYWVRAEVDAPKKFTPE